MIARVTNERYHLANILLSDKLALSLSVSGRGCIHTFLCAYSKEGGNAISRIWRALSTRQDIGLTMEKIVCVTAAE